jgi:hypothetical protein
VLEWWDWAYAGPGAGVELNHRFCQEAEIALALEVGTSTNLEAVFMGVAMKRLSLGRVHQLKEWA